MSWLRTVGYVLIVAGVAVAMEAVAWFLHKYVMHGFLWVLHEDHHHPKRRGLEKNDAYALFFSLLSMALIAGGVLTDTGLPIAIALGMTLYGVGYLLFHDVMFHRRIPGLRIRPRTAYLRRIYRAHSAHHRRSDPEDGIAFGFLYASPKYAGEIGDPLPATD